MDSFIAANKVGMRGQVIGIDMTDAQLSKARRLGAEGTYATVKFLKGFIEATGLPVECYDVVISNGVINLAVDKAAVFAEAARILKPGGRLAIADIVTDTRLPETISCNATLWAACIGGALQRDDYVSAIERAGFTVKSLKNNDEYRFISDNAQGASRKYGVRSISLLAIKN
jgi:ubiquinone/menaquinone biosynthesis C-methylase UbiE